MIYTSRYANPELASGKYTVVGITRGAPKYQLRYPLAGNIIEIAPPGYLFNEYDRGRFSGSYKRNMDRVGVAKVRSILKQYQALGKDVVLCCFEDVRKPNEWCHRLVFAEWWKEKTGEVIPELTDTSEIKTSAQEKKQLREDATKEEPQQMSLF